MHGLTLTQLARNLGLQRLQRNMVSLRKGLRWNFEVNRPGRQTIFKLFSEVDFLWRSPQTFSKVFSWTQGMACANNCPTWFNQPIVLLGYCSTLAGRFPSQVCYLCGLRVDVHQTDLPNAVTKQIFNSQGQMRVNITVNFGSLPSDDNRWVIVNGIPRAVKR